MEKIKEQTYNTRDKVTLLHCKEKLHDIYNILTSNLPKEEGIFVRGTSSPRKKEKKSKENLLKTKIKKIKPLPSNQKKN